MNIMTHLYGSTALCSTTLVHLVPLELENTRDMQIEVVAQGVAQAWLAAHGREATALELARVIMALDQRDLTTMDLTVAGNMLHDPTFPLHQKMRWIAGIAEDFAAPVIQ